MWFWAEGLTVRRAGGRRFVDWPGALFVPARAPGGHPGHKRADAGECAADCPVSDTDDGQGPVFRSRASRAPHDHTFYVAEAVAKVGRVERLRGHGPLAYCPGPALDDLPGAARAEALGVPGPAEFFDARSRRSTVPWSSPSRDDRGGRPRPQVHAPQAFLAERSPPVTIFI